MIDMIKTSKTRKGVSRKGKVGNRTSKTRKVVSRKGKVGNSTSNNKYRNNIHYNNVNIKLKSITYNDEEGIFKIVKNPDVMRYVGNGHPWSRDKVRRFILYNIEEEKQASRYRDYYSFKIINDYPNNTNVPRSTVLGIIEFHKFNNFNNEKYKDKYFKTIYLHPDYQGMGIANIATNLLLDKIKILKPDIKTIYSMVNIKNQKMIQFTKKHNIIILDTQHIKFGNNKYNIYAINIK